MGNGEGHLAGALHVRLALVCLVGCATAAHAQQAVDVGRYEQLLEAVERAQRALAEAPDEARSARRLEAIDAHGELLEWLAAYLASDDYAALDADVRGLVQRDLDIAGMSLTQLLAEAQDCEAALAELDATVGRTDTDERRAFVQAMGARLADCPEQGWVRLDVTPGNAEAHLDGAWLGPATGLHRAEAGPHVLELSAPNYEDHTLDLTVVAGAEQQPEPVQLQPTPPVAVEPIEWTLWTLGAAGIGVGIGYLVFAENRQADLQDLERRGAIIVDPAGERETNRQLRVLGGVTLGAGLLSATLGTFLFLSRRADDPPVPSAEVEVSGGPGGVHLGVGWSF